MKITRYALLFLSITLVITSISCSQKFTRASKSTPDFGLSPRIDAGQLDNGLAYYVLKNREPTERCFLRLNVAAGSFVETDEERGMAHFLEHLAFDDRSISGDVGLIDWFQRHGMSIGADANAETLPEQTMYKIDLPRCDEATITTALKIFRSFADGLKFRPTSIEKERNIIDAEEREYNNVETELTKRLLGHLYGGTLYVSRPVIGETAVRQKFDDAMFTTFYQKWYVPENISIVVVGDFGALNVVDLIKANFESMPSKKSPPHPISKNPNHKTPYFVLHENELAHVETNFSVQAKRLSKPNFHPGILKDKLAFDIALTLLQETYRMQFQQAPDQIREPIIEGTFLNEGVYELTLNVASQERDLETRFLDAYAVLKQIADRGFNPNDVEKTKAVMRDGFEQAVVTETTLNSDAWTERILEHINDRMIAIDATQYLMVVEPLLASITAQDCQQAIRNTLKSGNHYLYALGAIEETPKNVQRLEALMKRARNLSSMPAQENRTISFLYHRSDCPVDAPAPTRTPLPVIAGSQLRLGNDFEIIFKPTPFKTDEVQINIITSVGNGSMNKDDHARAMLAKLALFEGGLGKHSAGDLVQLVKDKYFNLTLSVYPDRIQGTIVTRNRDLPFALELAKAFVVDPNYDAAALARLKEQIGLIYQERSHQLWSSLEHDFQKATTAQDHRVGFVALEDFTKIDRDALLAWHKRYITEQPLRIVVVGDFKEDELAKTISCIFSDLPKRPKDKPAIPKLAYKSGLKEIYRVVTKDEAALIRVRYPLNFSDKSYPNHRLSVLESLIGDVVRSKLREKQQATYAPTVLVSENKSPSMQNWLDVTFGVAKADAAKIEQDLKNIIDKLATKGIDKNKLTKAVEPLITQAKKSLSDNTFWASVIANNFDDVNTLTWISRIESDIHAIQIKDINQLLRKYFRVKNASTAIVYPIEN